MEKQLEAILNKHGIGSGSFSGKIVDAMMEAYQLGKEHTIDLPNDIDIETWAIYECGGCSQESNDERIGLIRGAKWMRRQVLNAIK